MAQPQYLIVGLGNPGPDYLFTRHNIGFLLIDALADQFKSPPWQKKFQGHVTTATLGKTPLYLLKPNTFMNLSGQSVAQAARFYKWPPEQVIVIHDDIDLPAGKVRCKQGGGHGGHNGLKSIDAHLGQNYWRIRLGVGHPGDKAQVSGYVLSPFSKSDQTWLTPLFQDVIHALPHLLAGKPGDFLSAIRPVTPQR